MRSLFGVLAHCCEHSDSLYFTLKFLFIQLFSVAALRPDLGQRDWLCLCIKILPTAAGTIGQLHPHFLKMPSAMTDLGNWFIKAITHTPPVGTQQTFHPESTQKLIFFPSV